MSTKYTHQAQLFSGKFVVAPDFGPPALMIADYVWWHNNEREILNWMAEHLPRGIEHQQGMTVTFDTEAERVMFLLKWS